MLYSNSDHERKQKQFEEISIPHQVEHYPRMN